jgi:hypothetical protein
VITIRPEAPSDFARLRELQRAAFAPSELEADIADAPPEAWMALALPAYEPHIRGRFRFNLHARQFRHA